MFMKQYNYKPRSASTSSQGSQSGSPPKGGDSKSTSAIDTTGPAASGPVSAGVAGRRRSSAAGADKFAGLNAVKRNSQDDKKASFSDQKVGGSGILGGMWESFTKK